MNNFPTTKRGATLPESHRKAAAKAFLANADWKVLSVRAGREDAIDHEAAPVTAVWFTKGIRRELVRDVLELLGAQESVENPIVDRIVQPGKWFHRFAEYKKDGGVSERGDTSFTLYRTMGGGADGFARVIENGCLTTTTVRFMWDVGDIEDAPPQRQGFDSKIGGVTQDQLTKLFSYYISITELHTFHDTSIPTTVTKFNKTYEESWTGMRGTKLSPVTDNINPTTKLPYPISIPPPGTQPNGTLVRHEWGHDNQFCTWSVRISTTVAIKDVLAAEACSKDQFNHSDSKSIAGAVAKLGPAPEPADGLTFKHASKLREDGLLDNSEDKNQELAVMGAEVTTSVDLFTEETATADQQVAMEPPAASVIDGVTTHVAVSKTPGKRKNIRVNVRKENYVPAASVTKSSTIFEDAVEVRDKSSRAAPPDPIVGDGLTQNITMSKTPGDRKDISTASHQEKEVGDASVTSDIDLFHERSSTVTRNSSGAIPTAHSSNGIGVKVSAEKTPGGRKHISTQTEEERYVGRASVSLSKTIFESESSITDQHSTSAEPTASVGSGVLTSVNAAKSPHGRRNIVVSTKTELPVDNATIEESGDIFQSVSDVGDMNKDDPGGVTINPAVNKLASRGRAKTPGGKHRITNRTTTFHPHSDVTVSRTGSLVENSESKSSVNQLTIPTVITGFVEAGAPIRSLQYRRTGANAYDTVVGVDTPTGFLEYTIDSEVPGTGGAKEYIVTFHNATNANLGNIIARYPGMHIVPGYGWNKFALMDGTIKFVPWIGRGGGYGGLGDLHLLGKRDVKIEVVTLDGVPYKKVTTSLYNLVRHEGIEYGMTDYSGALNGSSFNTYPNDWYFYKKVYNIKIQHTEITNIEAPIEQN